MFILRHGETLWNVAGRMQGGLDSPLTELGRAQARAQGEILRHAGATDRPLFCSPQGRALETARVALPGRRGVADARLAEVAMGSWQGMTREEIARTTPHLDVMTSSFLWKFSAPGGERLAQMLARIREFLAEAPADAVVVTHGVTSQLLRGCTMSLSIEEMDALEDLQGVIYQVSSSGETRLDP